VVDDGVVVRSAMGGEVVAAAGGGVGESVVVIAAAAGGDDVVVDSATEGDEVGRTVSVFREAITAMLVEYAGATVVRDMMSVVGEPLLAKSTCTVVKVVVMRTIVVASGV
jgi:hypothetical protein